MRCLKDSGFSKDNFIRPNNTNPYVAGDVVSDNSYLTFNNLTKIPGSKIICMNVNMLITISATPSGMGAYRLHLYSTAPTAINDNDQFNISDADLTKYLGYLPIVVPIDLGSKIYSQNINTNKMVDLGYGLSEMYGILETVNAYTPSALDRFYIEIGTLGADGE